MFLERNMEWSLHLRNAELVVIEKSLAGEDLSSTEDDLRRHLQHTISTLRTHLKKSPNISKRRGPDKT